LLPVAEKALAKIENNSIDLIADIALKEFDHGLHRFENSRSGGWKVRALAMR
jgi:hypothetical protein